MGIADLKEKDKIPARGKILAYFQGRIYYASYHGFQELEKALEEGEKTEGKLLELHCFNEKQEYRAVYSQLYRSYLESVVDDSRYPVGEYEKLEEEILIEENWIKENRDSRKIRVVNYFRYNEDDLLKLVDYRLGLC